MAEAREWQASRPRFYIDQLQPNSTSDIGVIAGRWQLGKTNISIELLVCLATGEPFYGLQTEQIPVGLLDFEGNSVNITERLEKILQRHSTPPPNYLNLVNLKDKRFILHDNTSKLVDEAKGAKLVIIDGGKHLIGGEYIKPSKVKEFGEDLIKAMVEGKFCSVVTWQVRKPHEQTLIAPGDLDTLKGAADIVEDSTFALLLEKPKAKRIKSGKIWKWIHPPENYVNLYIGKAKEAVWDYTNPIQKFSYHKDTCEFRDRSKEMEQLVNEW